MSLLLLFRQGGGGAVAAPAAINSFAGGRKAWLIDGVRHWLTDWEFARLVAQMEREAQQVIRRAQVSVVEQDKPRTISRKTWASLKKTLTELEALSTPEAVVVIEDESDDEEALLMLM